MSAILNLESKGVALVTGAAQGIGHAIALRLAADGFDVALNDIAPKVALLEGLKKEIMKTGRAASVFCGDVSVDAEVKAMVEGTVETLGGLDVMIANAGVCRPRASLIEVDVVDWDDTFAINVRGMFLCYKYAGKQMLAQGRGGRIIGASSDAGKQAQPGLPDYSASKFAIRGLTQAAALEFGKHGITVNAYAPGAVITSMTAALAELWAPAAGLSVEAFTAAYAKQSAIGKNQTPEEIAALVSFLASKESAFITGQSISADGGRYFD
ncbi:NAD-binding protein [Mycena galericulata]|nr:NAD-binding protein [Mycena galericulata]